MRAAVTLVLVSILVLAYPATAVEHQVDRYGPAAGVRVAGAGVASNAPAANFMALTDASRVTVTVQDDVAPRTGFSVCIDLDRDGVCAAADGDAQAGGVGTVSLAPAGGIRAGTRIVVAVYTLSADGTGVGAGTSGTAWAVFA